MQVGSRIRAPVDNNFNIQIGNVLDILRHMSIDFSEADHHTFNDQPNP
jgi:hypothetical protein